MKKDGWQTAVKARTPEPPSPPPLVTVGNRYEALSQPESPEPPTPKETPPTAEPCSVKAKPARRRPRKPKSPVATKPTPHGGGPPPLEGQNQRAADAPVPQSQVASPVGHWRPFRASYFLPGKIEGRPVQCLIDTGCTTNLLGKHVFDRLPANVRARLTPSEPCGSMADGSKLPFYGSLAVSALSRTSRYRRAS